MAWTAANIPDLSGRTAVVTGANSGLGLESAKALAGAGAHVILAARTPVKTADAVGAILAAHPGASLEVVPLDLASQAGITEAAATIVDSHPTVDILMNNAGLMAMPEGRTEDGFETQLGVNHLGHWTLTALLMPALLAADAARVVTVTSVARLNGRPVDPANPNLEGEFDPWRAYGQAKLANMYFALGLQRDFARAGVHASSVAAHPGIAHTDLQKRTVREGGAGASGPRWERIAERRGLPPARGALSQLRAATDPRATGGSLYGPMWGAIGNPVRRLVLTRRAAMRQIDSLWDVSESMTGVSLGVREGSLPR